MCEGESWIFVGTTDVSLPVKNNTDSMNQLVRYMFLPGWTSMSQGISDMCRDHRPPVKNNTDRMNQLVR